MEKKAICPNPLLPLPSDDPKDKTPAQLTLFENLEKWLTTEEAAQYLRISPKCLLNLTSQGKVRYYKLGRRNRFLLSELKQLLLAQPRGGLYGN